MQKLANQQPRAKNQELTTKNWSRPQKVDKNELRNQLEFRNKDG